MMREQIRNSRRAFTLLELLVVILIIGVLAALLFPALPRAKGAAKATTCKSRLHQMGVALGMYVHDHGDRYPYYLGPPGPGYGDAVGPRGGKATGGIYWSSQFQAYYPMSWTNRSSHCPGYAGANAGPEFYAAQGGIDRIGSYGYNIDGVRSDDHASGHVGLGPAFFWSDARAVSESEIKVPSEMIAVADSRFLNAAANQAPGGKDDLRCGLPGEPFEASRHGKNYNYLLCDGHVAAASPWLLFDSTKSAMLWNYDHQAHSELWVNVESH